MTDGTRQTTIAQTLWPVSGTQQQIARAVALVLLGSLLMTLSARVQVPFWPVPMTMQTFAALVIGAAYGSRLAGISIATYLAQGALGLPVFAGGAGLAYLAGPTGGYLIGFLAAAIVVGWFAERGYDRRVATAALMFLVGDAVIFALGLAWLSTLIGIDKAIGAGLVPFLPGEALKIALAIALMPLVWRARRGR